MLEGAMHHHTSFFLFASLPLQRSKADKLKNVICPCPVLPWSSSCPEEKMARSTLRHLMSWRRATLAITTSLLVLLTASMVGIGRLVFLFFINFWCNSHNIMWFGNDYLNSSSNSSSTNTTDHSLVDGQLANEVSPYKGWKKGASNSINSQLKYMIFVEKEEEGRMPNLTKVIIIS